MVLVFLDPTQFLMLLLRMATCIRFLKILDGLNGRCAAGTAARSQRAVAGCPPLLCGMMYGKEGWVGGCSGHEEAVAGLVHPLFGMEHDGTLKVILDDFWVGRG